MNRFRLSVPNGFGTLANGPYPNQFGDTAVLLSAELVDRDSLDMALEAEARFNIICFDGITAAQFTVADRQAAWTISCTEADRLAVTRQPVEVTVACYDSKWQSESMAGRFEVTLVNSQC